ncbi:MAG: HAD family hydrolase [Gemmatimonadales bacterium]
MTRRLVLFDIDGTLMLSGGAGRRAILAAMAEVAGLASDLLDRVRFDGKTDPQIVAELFDAGGQSGAGDPDRVTRILDRYLAHLEADLAVNAALAEVMPGIRPLLDSLVGDDRIVLGLLTGNVSRGAELKLRAVQLEFARFRVGAFGSDHAVRSELPPIAVERAAPIFGRRPSGADVVIIGDTPADVTCGRGVGATAVGVATGSYSSAALTEAGAAHVFEDLSDTDRVRSVLLDGL